MSPDVSIEETEHEWYQNMYESLPRSLFNGRVRNIKTTNMDIIKYTFDNEPCYIPYDELWDSHLESPNIEHVELFERFISEKTHLTKQELETSQYWSLHPKLGMVAHFPRGDYEKSVPVKRIKHQPLKARTLDFDKDFSITYKGSIIIIKNNKPCPSPSSAFSNGVESLLSSLDIIDTQKWNILFSDSSPLLLGHEEAINKVISEGNRSTNAYIYTLEQVRDVLEGTNNE